MNNNVKMKNYVKNLDLKKRGRILTEKRINELARMHSEFWKENFIKKVKEIIKEGHYNWSITKTLKENMSALKNLLLSEFNVDYLSITYTYQGKHPKLTVGENNQVFEDLTSLLTQKNELEQYVLEKNSQVLKNIYDK